MTDRPIFFSAPMILALLAGRKTQTRRVLSQPTCLAHYDTPSARQVLIAKGLVPLPFESEGKRLIYHTEAPRIAVGDRLWCREAWRTFVSLDDTAPRDLYQPGERGAGVLYEADGSGLALSAGGARHYGQRDDPRAFGKLRPGMFMPRWASRLTLTVTGVKVDRLLNISEEDAIAEGIGMEWCIVGSHGSTGHHVEISEWRYYCGIEDVDGDEGFVRASDAYFALWDHINGPKSTDANPWVAAYSFSVEKRNIDEAAR